MKCPKIHPYNSISNGIWSTWKIVNVERYLENCTQRYKEEKYAKIVIR